MVTVYDVPADQLIARVAVKLKGMDSIKVPDWAEFARTGRHTEKAPVQDDWWYTRTASVLRKIYTKGPMGSEHLAAEYGGFSDRGSKPNKAVKGSRSIARKTLMQLESSGLVVKNGKKGRMITAKGQAMLDGVAKEVFDEMNKA